nr:uncharacterized protein LOC101258040 [Solanum lycopersicum]
MTDFNFDSTCTSPYISAPSSPQHFGTTFFFSAPTSPTRISALHSESNVADHDHDNDNDDFAFEFSGYEIMEKSTIAADELFDGGKIKLKQVMVPIDSPKMKKNDKDSVNSEPNSSMRVSGVLLINENAEKTESSVSSLWKRRWKLKDLLLFRSASESRASSNTIEMSKYALVKKVREEEGSSSSLRIRKMESNSAHELHYKMKKEVLKDMKKKTFLPYKQSVLSWHGCYGLDDTITMYISPRS